LGTIKYDWVNKKWSLTFSSSWAETYTYDSNRGYSPKPNDGSFQTRSSVGAGCTPVCGVSLISDAMPPLVPSLAPAYLTQSGSSGCLTYTPNKDVANQFITSFTAFGSGASTMICTITLKDGRLLTIDRPSLVWGQPTINIPTGCICNNQMDIWILVDHSSSISDSKMVQFKTFVQQFLDNLNIKPDGINVGMSWFHYDTGINFNITGDKSKINIAMNQWWTNCSAAAAQCAATPSLGGCSGCQKSGTATSTAIQGYNGATTNLQWPGSMNVLGAVDSFYNPTYGGSSRQVPKMFLTLTDGAVNMFRNQNGGVTGCIFSACAPDLTAAVSSLRARHTSLFPSRTLTTISMGIGAPGSDPNLSLSPEHLLTLAEGKPENTFTVVSFDALAANLNNLLLRSCPASNDVVQSACQDSCCGLCVCGSCKPPTSCVDDNLCTNQVQALCCNTVPAVVTTVCPAPNKCTLMSCDPRGKTGGTCVSQPVDCSGFIGPDNCTTFSCNMGTGLCTLPNTDACPPRDCTWGPWSQWTTCTVSCGTGPETRSRSPNSTALNGGQPCTGPSTDTRTCDKGCCPTNCVQTAWSTWGPACGACGVGTQTRSRTTTAVETCGGTTCGITSDSRDCPACVHRNCSGSNYTGTCNCTSRTTTLTFRVTQTQSGNGLPCPFPDGQVWTIPCTTSQNNSCPVPCNEAWSSWTLCDCNRHVQNRTHYWYSNPRNGGTPCAYTTNFSQTQACTPGPIENCPLYGPLCDDETDCVDGFACTRDECRLEADGRKHCYWLNPTVCTRTLCMSSNTCDERLGCVPVYRSVGQSCPTASQCNKSQCIDSFNGGLGGCNFTITDCSSLTVGCQRYRCDPANGRCSISDRSLCPPIDCQWAEWGAWGNCDKSCGGGSSIRRRTQNVTATDGGLPCPGGNSETLPCNSQCCPVDCAVNGWSQWSACSLCSTANRTRTRTIRTNPSCNGTACDELNQTQVCPPCTPQDCEGVNITGPCACTPDGTAGTTLITFSITKPAVGSGANCSFPDGQVWNVSCTPTQVDGCPKPCIDVQTNWSNCNCYTFKQTRSYYITQPAQNGGRPCTFLAAFNETQDCVPVNNCTYLGPTCVFKEDCNDEIACTLDACTLFLEDSGYHCDWTGSVNCTSTNICESGFCDLTVGCRRTNLTAAAACPTSDPCNISICDNSGNGGNGECLYSPKDCSAFTQGCQRFQCDKATGQCSLPDRSLCPPIPCTYGEWEAWTACPVTCSIGVQTRIRNINQTAADGGPNCTDPANDTKTCDMGCCPVDCVMTEWTAFLPIGCPLCPTFQNQTRTRNITTPMACGGLACGPTVDNSSPCPPCAPIDCVGYNETLPCNCSADGEVGTHVKIFYISVDQQGTGKNCSFPNEQNWTESCNATEINGCPKPCIAYFTNWSVCDCYNASQYRSYIITQQPRNGGTPCLYATNYTMDQGCTVDPSCPTLGPKCVTNDDCNDGKPCTVDRCLYYDPPGTYNCDWSEVTVCNDSSVCTSDICDDIKGCVYSQQLFCNDGSACTRDWCDNVTGCQNENIECPDFNACQLGDCNNQTGCTFRQKNCSENITLPSDNCTSTYCDVNYTSKGLNDSCVTINLCQPTSLALAIGLSAGIIAGIVLAAILALAVCGGGTAAAATRMAAMNSNSVMVNPLYTPNQQGAANPLFNDTTEHV